MAGGITPAQATFAASVLKGIGAPATPQNVAGFVGWAKAEGGDNWQRNNPLNTTESAGSTGSINSVGVRVYPNPQAGVQATIQTLNNGHYGGIIGAFRSQNVKGLAGAIGSSPWGTSGSLAAQTIAETLGQPVPQAGAAALPAISTPSLSPVSVPVTTQAFDQAGFKEAMGRFLAGSFVQQQGGASNPYNASPGSSKGFSGSLSGSNPLLASGQLTTTAPNAQDFVTTQTGTVAQHQLQQLAGPATPLATHPAVAGSANKILQMALSVLGAPYNQATHASALTETAAQLKKTGTDCSGFVSWLMGPDGLGIWKTALATPDIQHAPGMQAGTGQTITVYNNPLPGNSGHVFVEIDGRFFQSAGGGVGIQAISSADAQQMIKGGDNGAPYTALHPKGF